MPRIRRGQSAPPHLELDHFLPYRLSVLTNTVSAAIARTYAKRFSLSIPEWRVMAVLAREPGLSAAQVVERTAMDKVAVSRAVSRLVRARRVHRTLARGDRRRSVLALAAAGADAYAAIAPWAIAYERALTAALTADEAAALDRIIAKLLQRAHELADTGVA